MVTIFKFILLKSILNLNIPKNLLNHFRKYIKQENLTKFDLGNNFIKQEKNNDYLKYMFI